MLRETSKKGKLDKELKEAIQLLNVLGRPASIASKDMVQVTGIFRVVTDSGKAERLMKRAIRGIEVDQDYSRLTRRKAFSFYTLSDFERCMRRIFKDPDWASQPHKPTVRVKNGIEFLTVIEPDAKYIDSLDFVITLARKVKADSGLSNDEIEGMLAIDTIL